MSGQTTGGRTGRRALSLSAAFVLVATIMQVLGSAPAGAAPCADPQTTPVLVAGFEIDGNLCLNTTGTMGELEWDTVGGQPVRSDPSGASDTTAWTGGAAENGWPWTPAQTQGTNPSSNADITHAFAVSQIVDGEVIAYFGWERAATTGTVGFYVELNQEPNRLAAPGVPGPVANRTDGDLRLRFIQQGNALLALDVAHTWQSTGPSSGAWNPVPVGDYAARTNGVAVSNLPGLTPNPMAPGTFAEVAVNISDLFGGIGGCSGEFGYVNLRSTSSLQATNPPLQDWVRPIDVGVPSTCPSVVLQKRWVNGSEDDSAGLSINGATASPGLATSTATGAQDVTDTTNRATVDVEPSSVVTLAETLAGANTGTYTSTLGCDNGVLTPPAPGRTGSFTKPPDAGAGDSITCTITNTRTRATLTLTKTWDSSAPGDTAELFISGADSGITGPATSTAPGSTTITAPVFSGEAVTVVEHLGDANVSSYDATTDCTNVDDLVPGDTGASFTVPDAAPDIACTITNTAVPARLTLMKRWVRGAPGDSADLTITSPTDTDSAVAVVPAGRTGRSTTVATLPLIPGDTVTLSETLPAAGRTNTGSYEPTSLVCGGEPVELEEPATGPTATATFTVPSSDPVTCVFTNEARHTVELTKEWGANAVAGDTADLSIVNSTTGAADSVAATAPDRPATPASVIAAAGESIEVEEVMSHGAYAVSLSCTGGVTPEPATGTSSSFTMPSDLLAGEDVTCTFTNTARYTVELTKEWGADAVAGDTADLTLANRTTGTMDAATATAPNPPGAPPSVPASAGDLITLDEVFGPGNVAYDASARCTAGPLTTPVPGTTDEFEVPSDLPAGSTLTCTFTNTPRAEPPPPPPSPPPPPLSPSPPPTPLPATLGAPVIRTVTSHARVAPGEPFHDRIHLGGLAGGRAATADAELYGPFPSRAAASCRARFRVRTLTTRVRNGWNRTPSIRIDAPGVYTWRVITRADAANLSATHRCGQAAETTVVAKETYVAPAVVGGYSGTIRSSDHARRAPLRIAMPDVGMHAVVRSAGIVAGRMTLPGDVADVGWLRRSAGIGDTIGNAIIGGHVSDRHDSPGAMFHLEGAQVGQPVTVTKAGSRHRFKVVSKATYGRRHKLPQRYFATTGPHHLVLISCTGRVVHPDGRFHYTRYLVVVAEAVHRVG